MTRRGNREPPGNTPKPATDRKSPGFAETLRRQFRECVKRLTDHRPDPPRKARRRRSEDTGRTFIMVARQVFRRMVRSIFHVSHFTWRAPDTPDPANLYQIHAQNAQQSSQAANDNADPHRNLSLRL
jgi:hypothetical protein